MLRKLKELSRLKKVGLGIVGLIILASISSSGSQPKQASLTVQHTASSTAQVLSDQTAADSATAHSVSKASAPIITTQTVTETQSIPFASTTAQDSTLAKGKTKLKVAGVNGVSTLTYKLTLTDGKQTAKELISQVTTTQPVAQVTAIGTYVAPVAPQPVAQTPAPTTNSSSCDPNYSGCVPIASDVDCAGGGGNGPAYVSGPIRVIGSDIYGLDRDHNGIACE